jgi:hypothetical protein
MTKIKDTLLGRTKTGEKFYLTIELKDHAGSAVTVDHETVTGYRTMSFTGTLISKYGSIVYERGYLSGGQIYRDLLEITEPAKGFTLAGIKRIYELWQELHLNDFNSHCAHQDKAVKWDEVEPCSVTGYRAGSAWLLNPLNSDLVNETFDLVFRNAKAVA